MRVVESLLILLRRRRAAPILAAVAALGMLGLFACAGMVVVGLLIAPQVIEEEQPAPVRASDTPAPASDLYISPVSPLATPTAPLPADAAPEASRNAQPTDTAATPIGSALPSVPGEPTPPTIPAAAGTGGPETSADTPPLIEPIDVPGPTDTLQLVATSQLTLSSVIFVENTGHFPEPIRFSVRGAPGGTLWLADDALWIALLEPRTMLGAGPGSGGEAATGTAEPQRGVMLKLTFPGANRGVRVEPFTQIDTKVSYLSVASIAGESAAPAWGGVRYANIYPGIDLELTSEGDVYTQRLIVAPGADLSEVRLQVEGAQAVTIQHITSPVAGDEETSETYYLEVSTELGTFALPLFVVAAPDLSLIHI